MNLLSKKKKTVIGVNLMLWTVGVRLAHMIISIRSGIMRAWKCIETCFTSIYNVRENLSLLPIKSFPPISQFSNKSAIVAVKTWFAKLITFRFVTCLSWVNSWHESYQDHYVYKLTCVK